MNTRMFNLNINCYPNDYYFPKTNKVENTMIYKTKIIEHAMNNLIMVNFNTTSDNIINLYSLKIKELYNTIKYGLEDIIHENRNESIWHKKTIETKQPPPTIKIINPQLFYGL